MNIKKYPLLITLTIISTALTSYSEDRVPDDRSFSSGFAKLSIYYTDPTPLMQAIVDEQPLSTIAEIIHSGADINAIDGYGNTALHYACFKIDDKPLFMLLLGNGIDTSLENDSGETAGDVLFSLNSTYIYLDLLLLQSDYFDTNGNPLVDVDKIISLQNSTITIGRDSILFFIVITFIWILCTRYIFFLRYFFSNIKEVELHTKIKTHLFLTRACPLFTAFLLLVNHNEIILNNYTINGLFSSFYSYLIIITVLLYPSIIYYYLFVDYQQEKLKARYPRIFKQRNQNKDHQVDHE